MLLNYLKILWLKLKSEPGLSAIRVISLAIGLGCSILVISHVQYVASFDKHIPNYERTYRLVSSFTTDQRIDTWVSSEAYAPQLRLQYPQIEYIARLRPDNGLFSRDGDAAGSLYYWAEPDIIDIFSLDFIAGEAATALDEPNSVVLSETMAQRYFPGEPALGQILTLDGRADLQITGVMRDLPANTHINMQILVSAETGRRFLNPDFMGGTNWLTFNRILTYLTVASQAEGEAINNDLENFVSRNAPEGQKADIEREQLTLSLEPIADIYLSPRQGIAFRQETTNRAQILLGLSAFSIMILITSCINFANLSLAQVHQRGKEVGIRKTLGAGRAQVTWQFLFESLLLTLIALIIALPFIELAIPVYTNLTSTAFTSAAMLQTDFILLILLFVIATGVLTGLIPALLLARFEPAIMVKGMPVKGRRKQMSRSLATVFQFGIATALILLAAAVSLQIDHLNTMNIGFNKNDLVVLDTASNSRDREQFDYTAMLNELEQHPGVVSVAKSNVLPPDAGDYDNWRLPGFGPDEYRTVSHYVVDENYMDTMQFQLLAGRGFQPEFATDFMTPPTAGVENPAWSIVITRSAVRNFGFNSPEDALDEIFIFDDNPYRVIGVIEDFRLSGGMEDTARSTGILRATRFPLRVLLLRLDPAQLTDALAHIDVVWARHRPTIPANRTFYDQLFNDMVQAQTNGISKASLFASGITVLISAFGLYALAFYSTQRRTKEVGVRKVVGATALSIIRLLTWDFLKPVFIACVLAWGMGYMAIEAFYEPFSSRVDISPLLYVAVTMSILLLALLTVATQCYRTANARPVLALRYE